MAYSQESRSRLPRICVQSAIEESRYFDGASDDLYTMADMCGVDGRTGVICIFLCFAVGISNLFHVSIMILFGALCL